MIERDLLLRSEAGKIRRAHHARARAFSQRERVVAARMIDHDDLVAKGERGEAVRQIGRLVMRNDNGAELWPCGLAFHFKVCCRVGHEVMAHQYRRN